MSVGKALVGLQCCFYSWLQVGVVLLQKKTNVQCGACDPNLHKQSYRNLYGEILSRAPILSRLRPEKILIIS